jgi:hypothetical protein
MNDDTISRKSVIDAVHTATYRFICGAEDGDEMTDADILVLSINKAVCAAIKALPTAHPQKMPDQNDDDETCDSCRFRYNDWDEEPCDGCTPNDSRYCPDRIELLPSVKPESTIGQLNTDDQSTKTDVISRRAVIDALDALCDRECEYSKKQRSVMCGACRLGSAFDVIDELPSAQPEQIARDIATIIENEQDMRVLNAPSAQPEIPEIIRCKDCKYAEVADKEDRQDGYTCQFHRGSIWFSGSYCSWAERRQEADSSGNISGTQKELKCTETHSCDCERTETHEQAVEGGED